MNLTMTEPDVRIQRLPAMRVAWVLAVGHSPEQEAWRLLSRWARPAGLLEDPDSHPVFGFNNPGPSPGMQDYGYEMWVAVDALVQPPEGLGVKEFAGGLYAVTSCRLAPASGVPERWKALLRWVHTSPYTWRRTTHELERVRNPLAPGDEVVLDLYLPVEG